MMKWRILGLVALSWLITACATTTEPSKEYLLMDADIAAVEAKSTPFMPVQIMPVSIANYLAGNEIVLVTKQGEVFRSANNLWAETLSPQLTRLTQQRLERALPDVTWFGGQRLPAAAIAILNIDVDRFYADLEGMIHISGRWQLMSSMGELLASNTFDQTDRLTSDGFTPMVQALSKSWFNNVIDSMATDIALSLNK
ncbi:MAG: ABC-type transport auxiliary lipoprotein family protein [Marinomonas sp.]